MWPEPAETQADEIAKLHEIATRLLAEHKHHERALNGRLPDDNRDRANMMLALRGVELATSAADDFHYNRPAAGTVLGRALLETALTLRWCLKCDDNASHWWLEGDAAIQKSARTLALSDDPAVVALRQAKAVGVGLPKFTAMASQVGLTGPYTRWYSTLSAYAHPSRMSMMHSYGRPSAEPPPALVLPCIYFANDIGTVFSSWANHRKVPSPWPHP